MKNIKIFSLIEVLILSCIFSACGKQSDAESETEEAAAVEKLTLVNTKSEVKTQIESLASKYAQETGITVEVIGIEAGANVNATIKGFYLSDQMPDIICCEAADFSNWDGLLVDLSDQDWVNRTDAEFVDPTFGTLGFPYTTEAIGLAYNADILSKCGVDPASITGPDSMRAAFEAIDAKKRRAWS